MRSIVKGNFRSVTNVIKSKLSDFKNVTDYSSQIGDIGMKYLSPELDKVQ